MVKRYWLLISTSLIFSPAKLILAANIVIALSWDCRSVMAANNTETIKSKPANTGQSINTKLQGDDSNRFQFENADLKMIVLPHTREQMKAFYEGRGFPQPAISAIAEACFMTVVVKNKTKDTLWLELDNWRFISDSPAVKRLDRPYWKRRWESLQIPKANRATFGWTLLPEQRDLQADEGVGGNITMAFTTKPFDITATFYQGDDKRGGPIFVHLTKIQCTE